jgi:putative transposase
LQLSMLRNVEDLLNERGIDISYETVRFWWNRFGPIFAAEIRRKRVSQMRAYSNGQWHLGEVFVKINGETHYLWRAADHEGEVLESFVHFGQNTKTFFCKPCRSACRPRQNPPP